MLKWSDQNWTMTSYSCRSDNTARVSAPKQEASQVAAGVMFRDTLTSDSRHVAVLVSTVHYDVKCRRVAGAVPVKEGTL